MSVDITQVPTDPLSLGFLAPAIAHRDGTFTPGGLQADPKKVIVRFDYKAFEGEPLNPGVEVTLAEEWHVGH